MRSIRRMIRAVALFLIVLMLAVPVYAATDLGLNVNGVTATTENQTSGTLSTSGDGSWTNSDGVLSGIAQGKKGMFSSYTGKATLTFSIPKAGIFSFRYKDLSLGSGSLMVDGTAVTAAGTFSKEFTEAGTVTVVIQSAKGANQITKATICDIGFLTTGATGVTFKAVPGVDYTVNGVSVTEETGDQVVSISTETVSVTAAYDDSTKIIREWKAEDGSAYSLEESGFAKPSESIVLTPVVGPRGTPQFTVNGARYYTWEEAFNGISDTTVTVTQSGTLPAGNYTVHSGVTLLIPFDTAGTCYTATPADNNNIPWETPTPYRTLTLASGAHLTINGVMSLSAKHHTGQALQNCGLTTGKYGHVDMSQDSTITVNSGGVLYSWGYITGSGSVTVKSGAKCYEYFVMQDFKDGNSLSDLSQNKDKRVFMTNNYYMQNVVVPMTIEAGSYLNGYSSCFFQTLKISKHAPISFVTPSSENGLFTLSEGEIRKRYDYATDRLYLELDGTAEMGNISITASTGIADITINSVDYDLSLGSNITLTLKSGAEMNLSNQSLVMIPGSELYIEDGASLNISSGQRFVLHDIDQWQKNYSYNARVHALAFVPNRTYTFKDSDLKDPLLMVNGTVDASGGYLYVTAGGGNTYSTDSGVVKFPAYSESTNSQYMRSGQTFDDYPITSAWLKNEDGSFVKHTANTAEDYSYNSEHGKWALGEHTITDEVTGPTCTTAGFTTHTCACGFTYTDTEVAALGHTMTSHEAKTPTCLEAGNSAYWQCQTCSNYYSTETGYADDGITETKIDENSWVMEPLKHKYDEGVVTTPATCTTDGVKTFTCINKVCTTETEGHTKTEVITSPGHNYGTEVTYTWTDYAKCTASRTCTVCTEGTEGHTESVETTNITSEDTTPATCSADGVKTYTATFSAENTWAGTPTKEETIPADGKTHTYPETWTQTKAPTCTEKGSEERKCTVEGCDATETREVKELDHDWATTLTRGEITHWYGCSRCDAKNREATHDYDWEVTKEATCYQEGSKSGTCSCGATATEVIDATGKHTYSETYTTENGSHWRACTTTGCTEKTDVGTCSGGAATCTTPATCSVCGQSYGTVDENAHNWGNWEVTTPASCTAEGEETRICSNNVQHTETKVIAKTAHAMTHHVRVEATCVAAGNVEYWNCSGCGLNYSDENGTTKLDSVDIAINSDAHDLKNVAAQSATCIQIGWDAYQKCQREGCNYSTYVEIPKLNHTDADNDGDHLCDADGCSEVVTTCEDTGKDHICDSDSACNIYSTGNNAHVDSDNDHACDYGCKVSIGECKDGDDADHKCDYGCGKDNLTDHNYGTEWKCDTTNHWHECICGDKADVTAHTYSSEETKAATCTEAGEMTYTCVCGRSYTEEIKAVGHRNTVTINEKAATCGTAGYTGDTFCNDCKTTIKEGETIGATGNHSYTTKASTSVKSEATCKDVAVYWAQCDNCTAVSDTATVNGTEKAPDNHVGGTEEIPEVPATCQTAGTTAGTKCLGCNTVISGCTEIAKQACADTDSDHICNNGCDQKLSECADNDTDHDCDVCGAAMGTHEAAEGKHTCDYCGETVTQCDDSDDADHYCDVCGKMVGGHTYGTEWKTDDTNHWHECACGEKSDLANHSYDDGVVTKEPTTEAEGEMTYTCKCGYSYIETIDKLVPQGYKVTLDDRTKGAAIRDGLEDGQIYAPGHTFTVTCSNACVVAISIDGGESYKELTCVVVENKENTYQFAVPEEVNGDFKIGIVLRGDANASGTVNAQDRVRISKYRNKTAELDALEYWAADANASGTVNAQDRVRISKYRNKTATLDWKLN